ncbi:MAG TPA: hypothetical protein IAC31_05175 [Candidatus Faecousia intestinigallinarum]|nr:hypothetical protein [Candidatus Faecousia intestinigallinarum]
MEFPKLSLPPKDYSLSDSLADKQQSATFAGKFYSVITAYQKEHSARLTYTNCDAQKQLKENACSTINAYYREMRCKIDEEMQAYILEHHGKIDSWSDSGGDTVLRYKQVVDAQFAFDYFGEDFAVTSSGKIARKSSKLIYQNCYRFPGTKEYLAAEEKRKQLKDRVKTEKNKGGRSSLLLSLIGFLYLLFNILFILGDMFFSCTGALDEFINSNMGIAFLAAMPYVLYSLILGIFGELSRDMFLFFTVILLGACLIGMLLCFFCFRNSSKNVKTLKQAKKELNRWIKSADYKKIVAENEELRKKNMDLAEQWHRAWYHWVCGIKDSAEEGWTEEVEVFKNALKELAEKTDFNALLKQKKE